MLFALYNVYCLPNFAALSAVDAQVHNEFLATVAYDQYQLSACQTRRRLMVTRLDVEFEDKTECGRAQPDQPLHASCKV